MLGDFFGSYWWNQNRIINRHPANGEYPREQPYDLNLRIQQHPTYDEFWRERCAAEHLHEIEVPLYSVGVWGKVDLHTRGNIDGFRRARGPKKLKMIGPVNAFVANREFNSRELHEKMLLPFYDHYLKGQKTEYPQRPAVEYFVRGADAVRTAGDLAAGRRALCHLAFERGEIRQRDLAQRRRAHPRAAAGEDKTSYAYPNPGWMMGVVGFGPNNAPDPARRVLTFTTAPLEQDLEIAGPIKLTLYASSTRNDMDFFVKLSEQMPQSAEDRGKALNPASFWITKGWLRASHRALDPKKSTEMEPYHTHADPAADRAGKNLPLRHQRRADGAPVQEGQSHSAGNRQRRLGRHRCAVDALLRAEQDRRRHDLSLGGAPFRAHLAGDGRRLKKSRAVPPLEIDSCQFGSDRVLQDGEDRDQLLAEVLDAGDDGHGNAGSDEPVFDRRRAGFVFQETLQLLEHWVPLPMSCSRRNHVTE